MFLWISQRANAAYKDTPETVIEHNVLYATQEEFVVIDEASRGTVTFNFYSILLLKLLHSTY